METKASGKVGCNERLNKNQFVKKIDLLSILTPMSAICLKLLSDWDDTCVILGSRNVERGEDAIRDIQTTIGIDECVGLLQLLVIDTSKLESVLMRRLTNFWNK